MAGIRWYRDAGRRVLTPRRDKPRKPRDRKLPRPKKLGPPKEPGVDKPHVKIPFVQAALAEAGKNYSVAGLNAVMRIAADNDMVIDKITWKAAPIGKVGKNAEHDCTPDPESLEPVCEVLDGRVWQGENAMAEFQSAAVMGYGRSRGYGIWALSHINCKCSIMVEMKGEQGRASFFVDAFSDPSEPKNSDMGKGSDPNSVVTNIASGFSFNPDKNLSTVRYEQMKKLSPEMLSYFNSFHIGEEEKVEKFIMDNDMFGADVYTRDIELGIKQRELPEEGVPIDTGEEGFDEDEDIFDEEGVVLPGEETDLGEPPAEGTPPAPGEAAVPEEETKKTEEEARKPAPPPTKPAVPPEEEEEELPPGETPPAPGV